MVGRARDRACLLRAWPGNVRELLAEINTAVIAALASGSATVGAQRLDPNAGIALAPTGALPAGDPADPGPMSAPDEEAGPQDVLPTRAQLIAALAHASGNVSAAA